MQKIEYKPIYYIDLATDFFKELFFQLGKKFAWMSSFVNWFTLQQMAETLDALSKSLTGLALTGFSFVEGYISEILTYDIDRYFIFFGSGVIVIMIYRVMDMAHKKYSAKTK